MKQVNISVSFDDEKLKALNRYMKKKGASLDAELRDALKRLYDKYVPTAVREYIDDEDSPATDKPKQPMNIRKEPTVNEH